MIWYNGGVGVADSPAGFAIGFLFCDAVDVDSCDDSWEVYVYDNGAVYFYHRLPIAEVHVDPYQVTCVASVMDEASAATQEQP